MTREHKLALILGFSVVLVVGALISDHFSDASDAQLEDLTPGVADAVAANDDWSATQPLNRTHASAPAHDGALPDGFSLDGEPQQATSTAPTAAALASRPVFQSGREALLSELQQTWETFRTQTQDAVPVAALDSAPAQTVTRLPEPTRIAAPEPRASHSADDAIPTKSHRVAEDESLWSIAQEHYGDGALYAKLAEFNRSRVGDDDTIHVGVVLRIPPRQALTGERPAPRQVNARPSKKSSKKASKKSAQSVRAYTVQDGDTLGEIAQRLLGSAGRWPEIVKLNGIDDPDVVPVGTILKLPPESR